MNIVYKYKMLWDNIIDVLTFNFMQSRETAPVMTLGSGYRTFPGRVTITGTIHLMYNEKVVAKLYNPKVVIRVGGKLIKLQGFNILSTSINQNSEVSESLVQMSFIANNMEYLGG